MQKWRRHLHPGRSYREYTPFWPLVCGCCPDCGSLDLSQSSIGDAHLRDTQFAVDSFSSSGSGAPPPWMIRATSGAGAAAHGTMRGIGDCPPLFIVIVNAAQTEVAVELAPAATGPAY